jgi:hypothetical protein
MTDRPSRRFFNFALCLLSLVTCFIGYLSHEYFLPGIHATQSRWLGLRAGQACRIREKIWGSGWHGAAGKTRKHRWIQ